MKITYEEFLRRAKLMHGDKYDYSKVDYIGFEEKVNIICHEKDEFGKEHGVFIQAPKEHCRGRGCPKCHNLYKDDNEKQERFLKRVKIIHGDKLDFTQSLYIKSHGNISVICHNKDVFDREHGEFITSPKNLLHGFGCPKCANKNVDTELFIGKAKLVHGDRYDYSKVNYTNSKGKVCIICPEHGEFLQVANSHLNGRGCPLCKTSHLESSLESFLKNNGVNYIYQYRDKSIFDKQNLDFFIEEIKLGIECQGEQHIIANFFKSRGIEYAENHLEYIKSLDLKKKQICEENEIELVYYVPKNIKHYFKNYLGQVFYDKNELLSYIKSRIEEKNKD